MSEEKESGYENDILLSTAESITEAVLQLYDQEKLTHATIRQEVEDLLDLCLVDMVRAECTIEERQHIELMYKHKTLQHGSREYYQNIYDMGIAKRKVSYVNRALNEAKRARKFKALRKFVFDKFGTDALNDFEF